MVMENMFFGNNLAKIRKGKNLTQDQLSKKSNVNASQIRKYETGVALPTIKGSSPNRVGKIDKKMAVAVDK